MGRKKIVRDLVVAEAIRMYVDDRISMTRIGAALNINREEVSRILRRNGIRLRPRTEWTGKLAGHWKGGRCLTSGGYWYVYKPDHPHAAERNQYVMEHRLVMEEKLGRYLEPNEIVHHINGDSKDNRPENLEVIARSVHVHNHFAHGKSVMALEEENRKLKAEVLRLSGKANHGN